MASYKLLSGSTNGLPIKVTQTATAGDTIHTAVSGTSSVDIIRLVAHNSSSSDVTLTVEFGGVTDPDDLIVKGLNIPANSSVPVVVDMPLQNSLVVKAFASSADVITITGEVKNITL